jgi:hypothetical protein
MESSSALVSTEPVGLLAIGLAMFGHPARICRHDRFRNGRGLARWGVLPCAASATLYGHDTAGPLTRIEAGATAARSSSSPCNRSFSSWRSNTMSTPAKFRPFSKS